MLVAFVSLRDFTLELEDERLHLSNRSKKYLRYITKASHRAPHLESFTIHSIYFDNGYIFRCERVDANWVVTLLDKVSPLQMLMSD
jgi:hypothetical protein